MATNTIPFATYTVKNESTRGVNIFLGVATKNNNVNTVDYYPNQVLACKTTYLFASIVGTRNVKITRPTTTDPYIYIQTRQVAPQQCPEYPATSLLQTGDNTGITLRTLKSDASITIEDNGCNYGLSTPTYDVQNVCNMNGVYYGSIGTPGKSNVVWMFKEIIGSPPCITVTQDPLGAINIAVNQADCNCVS